MNNSEIRQSLSHVIWIGGATDSGKTTIAQMIADKYGFQVYHYDRQDARQTESLAERLPHYRAFLDASLDDRWVMPEPEDLLKFVLGAFQDRFPLVLEDLLALPREIKIVAEGYGLTPDLVSPLLSIKQQAVWLVPTPEFKWASMQRRGKPSFRSQVSDPERATRNIFERDRLIAEHVKEQAQRRGFEVYEVDGSKSMDDMAALVERHFRLLS